MSYLNNGIAISYFGPSNFTNLNKIIKKPSIREYFIIAYGIPFSGLIVIFLLWMKFTVYVKMVKFLGVVQKVIEIIIYELITFIVLFAFYILAFMTIIYLCFHHF